MQRPEPGSPLSPRSPHVPLAPHGGLQAVVAGLAQPAGPARHVWEAAALPCAGITFLRLQDRTIGVAITSYRRQGVSKGCLG